MSYVYKGVAYPDRGLLEADKRAAISHKKSQIKQTKEEAARDAKLLINFNYIMNNIDAFRIATTTDSGVLNTQTFAHSIRIIELYSWLYTHTNLLRELLGLSKNQTEIVDIYEAHRIITETHQYMCHEKCSANQAIFWHIDWEKSPNNNRNKFK